MRTVSTTTQIEHGVLFKAELIRAFLANRKRMTRRIPFLPKGWSWHHASGLPVCPKGVERSIDGFPWQRTPKVGDLVYAKETHAPWRGSVLYKADLSDEEVIELGIRWKPSLFMRKEHSRIKRVISGIRYERLHELSEEDAIAEGVEPSGVPVNKRSAERLWTDYLNPGLSEPTAFKSFRSLWIQINGEAAWNANPLVRVISFEQSS